MDSSFKKCKLDLHCAYISFIITKKSEILKNGLDLQWTNNPGDFTLW